VGQLPSLSEIATSLNKVDSTVLGMVEENLQKCFDIANLPIYRKTQLQ
jgi:hypothetical protein